MRILALVASICLLPAITAQATSVVPYTVEELAQVAPVVVYGKIAQIDVDKDSGFRTAVLEAIEIAKAPSDIQSQRDFLIPLFNRAIPHTLYVEKVSLSPEFKLGEEVVAFLTPAQKKRADGQITFALMGFQQGKLRVIEDDSHVRRVASWDQIHATDLNTAELHAQTDAAIELQADLQNSSAKKATSKVHSSNFSHLNQDAVHDLEVPTAQLLTLDSVLNKARSAKAVSR